MRLKKELQCSAKPELSPAPQCKDPGSGGLVEDVQDPALSTSPWLQRWHLNHKPPLRN